MGIVCFALSPQSQAGNDTPNTPDPGPLPISNTADGYLAIVGPDRYIQLGIRFLRAPKQWRGQLGAQLSALGRCLSTQQMNKRQLALRPTLATPPGINNSSVRAVLQHYRLRQYGCG